MHLLKQHHRQPSPIYTVSDISLLLVIAWDQIRDLDLDHIAGTAYFILFADCRDE